MEDSLRLQNRRYSARFNGIYPVIYTRFDDQGRECDQKPSRSVNVGPGGVRLRSSFPVNPSEVLDVTVALEDTLISFMGRAVYVTRFEDHTYEFGISIKEIEDRDRIRLSRFSQRILVRGLEHDNVIVRGDRIMCPTCGDQIASVARVKDMITYCKEFLGQCACGERYEIKLYSSDNAVLYFPDKEMELIC